MIKKFKKINREFDINIDVDLSNIQGKRIFKFTFYIGDEVYRGKGETGNTSLWFPITESRGIKYIPEYAIDSNDNIDYFPRKYYHLCIYFLVNQIKGTTDKNHLYHKNRGNNIKYFS